MQFPSALDLVVKALEQIRETSMPGPRASRDVLDHLLKHGGRTNLTALSSQVPKSTKIEMLNVLNARVCACVKCPHLARSRTQTVSAWAIQTRS
jgi:hypothetical protein